MYADRTNEISGANRVTQAFIDKGTYIGGPTVPVTSGPNAYYGFDVITTVNAPVGTFGSTPDGSFQIVNPATAYAVKLPAYDSLVGSSDVARSKVFQTQLKTTVDLGSETSLTNLAFLGNGVSNKYETYGYDEYVPKNQTIQDRLTYHAVVPAGTTRIRCSPASTSATPICAFIRTTRPSLLLTTISTRVSRRSITPSTTLRTRRGQRSAGSRQARLQQFRASGHHHQ